MLMLQALLVRHAGSCSLKISAQQLVVNDGQSSLTKGEGCFP